MSSLPLGKFHPIPRVSTAIPSGCCRPTRTSVLPSQERNQISPCDAERRQYGTAEPPPSGPVVESVCSSGWNRFAVASPRGTHPAPGQLARSAGLLELKIGRTSSPWTVVPFGSNRKPPAVSRAQGPPSAPMMPASCKPELKTYWSAEPLGQKPPPATDDPVESVQMFPTDASPQETRLMVSAPVARANSRKPRFLAPAPGSGNADAGRGSAIRPSA